MVHAGLERVARHTSVADLHRTAARLGFRPSALLSMRTGHRIVNAALIGPAPWPRFLVLTDGLLSLLDPVSLRGVVAHEVGTARPITPLFSCSSSPETPVLLLHPAILVGVPNLNAIQLVAVVAVVVAAAWVGLRLLAPSIRVRSRSALGGGVGWGELLRAGPASGRTALASRAAPVLHAAPE